MRSLIDREGRSWDLSEPWLYRRHEFRGTAEELASYAVRNLGYVELQITPDRTRVTIRVRPDFFPQQTFETLVAALSAHMPTRISIRRDEFAGERFDILHDVEHAIALLDELRNGKAATQGLSFSVDGLSLARLETNPYGRLTNVYRHWRRARGRLSKNTLRAMLNNPLQAPWLLGSVSRGAGLITRTMPEFARFWRDDAVADLIDKPMQQHPDAAFGRAAQATYLRVHRTTQPSLELIAAVVQLPEGRLHWGRYHRLILPWRSGEETMLSCVSSVGIARDLASAAAS